MIRNICHERKKKFDLRNGGSNNRKNKSHRIANNNYTWEHKQKILLRNLVIWNNAAAKCNPIRKLNFPAIHSFIRIDSYCKLFRICFFLLFRCYSIELRIHFISLNVKKLNYGTAGNALHLMTFPVLKCEQLFFFLSLSRRSYHIYTANSATFEFVNQTHVKCSIQVATGQLVFYLVVYFFSAGSLGVFSFKIAIIKNDINF